MSKDFVKLMREIETKWQRVWVEKKIFEADPVSNKPKFFITVAYPYPNSPQHIGHGRTYSLTDVYARFKRMEGFNVLLPMAFHFTGTPVLAMAKRVRKGDKELIKTFRELYHVPEDKIKTFTEPLNVANYFRDEIKEGMKLMGFSIDWRREFTTIDSVYSKFITWQFHKLKEKGYIVKGKHPVGWCPSCLNAVGQHDTIGDVEPEIEETTLIKFKIENENVFIPVVTYRPETTLGVTNIWVNPEVTYKLVEVDGEKWITSERAVLKLKSQTHQVKPISDVQGNELVGKKVINPLTRDKVLVLPASFVDPNYGSGLVMSVPGHAPYDYVALEDLKKKIKEMKKFNLNMDEVQAIKPISLIKIEGFSEFPARDAVEKFKIKDQGDPKLEEATKLIYSKEFHAGVMKSNTGKYAGLKVQEAKEKIKEDLEKKKEAIKFYELTNAPVYCRCGTEVIVKVVEDQWFIDYGNLEWKKMVKDYLGELRIIPNEVKREFYDCVDWLKERACARRSGLGTRFPWDPDWIIESLSDSTIYMAYYTIAKYINKFKLEGKLFNNKVFDYVFLGKGNPEKISEETGIPQEILSGMRKEFEYWYPLDSRNSGRDLIWNHLTFFIFNHLAIFKREHWPKQIVVNGSVTMNGKKMSKTLGNIIPIKEAIKTYGADTLRLSILGSAELLSDADFSETVAKSTISRLKKIYELTKKFSKVKNKEIPSNLAMWDKWLLSRVQKHIEASTKALEECRVREALHHVFYLFDLEVSKYLAAVSERKNEEATNPVMWNVLNVWAKLLAPFAPHMAEEIWEKLGHKELVSVSSWPEAKKEFINEEVEESMGFVDSLIDDINAISKLLGKKPNNVYVYVAESWKFKLMNEIKKIYMETRKLDPKTLTKELMKKEEIKKHGKEVVKIIQTIAKTGQWIWLSTQEKEVKTLKETKSYIEKQTNLRLNIQKAEQPIYDPAKKSSRALPGKPALYLE